MSAFNTKSIITEKMYILAKSEDGNDKYDFYIFSDTLKTKGSHPKNGWKIGTIENCDEDLTGDEYTHSELLELKDTHGVEIRIKEKEKWLQVVMNISKLYPNENTDGKSGWRYEETSDGKFVKDIVYKHFHEDQYSIPCIIETKDIGNSSKSTVDNQIKKYIQDNVNNKHCKILPEIFSVGIVVDVPGLFFDLFALNKINFEFFDGSKYITQKKKNYKWNGNKKEYQLDYDKADECIADEIVGVISVLKYDQKIEKKISSQGANGSRNTKIENEYRVAPDELHRLGNHLNPRELIEADSYNYLGNILTDLLSNEVKNSGENTM